MCGAVIEAVASILRDCGAVVDEEIDAMDVRGAVQIAAGEGERLGRGERIGWSSGKDGRELAPGNVILRMRWLSESAV